MIGVGVRWTSPETLVWDVSQCSLISWTLKYIWSISENQPFIIFNDLSINDNEICIQLYPPPPFLRNSNAQPTTNNNTHFTPWFKSWTNNIFTWKQSTNFFGVHKISMEVKLGNHWKIRNTTFQWLCIYFPCFLC